MDDQPSKKPVITDEPRLKANGWIALSMIALKQTAIERDPFMNQPRSACLPVASSGSPVRDPAAPWSQRAGKWPSESVRRTEPGSHSPYKCSKHFGWIRWVFSLTYNLSRRSRGNSERAEHPMADLETIVPILLVESVPSQERQREKTRSASTKNESKEFNRKNW